MPGTNLTRSEAIERAEAIRRVESYHVELDLTRGERVFGSRTTVRFSAAEGASSFIDAITDTVRSVTLNGTALDVASVSDGVRIQLPSLSEQNELVVDADAPYMNTGEGLHRFVDPVDGEVYLYTQFEVPDSRRMFAVFEQPDLKASFRFTVTAPSHWDVVSNSPTPRPERVPGADARSVWDFTPTGRISSYITALIAGPYQSVRDELVNAAGRTIPLAIFARKSLMQYLDAENIFSLTKAGFAFYEREFGCEYPFEKYDQLFVPEFNAGAMENAGAVTILESYVFRSKPTQATVERRAITVLHELAHMWFGDLVTMRWWDDLWLNESFAEYASTRATAEATRWTEAWTTFCNVEKAWAYRQDQLPTTHPIASDIVDIEAVKVNFDGITYAKGASVLKQLAHYVGEDAFTAALRGYFRRHEYANTTLQDLLDALAEASGRDLSTWSKEWLQTAGVNTLRPRFEVDADGRFTSFDILQEAPEDHPTLRSHRLRIGLYDRTSEGVLRRDQVEIDVVGAETAVPAFVGMLQPDLVLINDDDLAYTKIRLDERSQRTLVDHIGEFRESLPRALCWTSAWDMTRDAEMPAGDYLELVLAGIHQETEIGTVHSLLRLARQAVDPFGDPARRAERTRRLADRAAELMFAAEPGSDMQLAYARSLAANAVSDEHLQLLADLLAGTREVAGLAVDTELRWALLLRLVIMGRAGDAEIDAELDRDHTAAGQRHALSLRAARPTAEAKDEAWRLAVHEEDLPNAEQAAIIAGFQQYEHRELLKPFIERYFDCVASAWENRTSEMAQQIAIGLFPVLLVEQATIDRADSYLREARPVPPLRRLISESRDNLARALRAQHRDAQDRDHF